MEGGAYTRGLPVSGKPVRVLDGEVARKIAAGEVIDRPAAVVRELLDNAIDSGATKISVEITGGGADSIRVSDNGCGMTAEDLALCTQTHTTSKIENENDLLALCTLGFRGEALSSISAVSDLSIISTRDGREAWKFSDGRIHRATLSSGTIVNLTGLFNNFPARKQFLKRAAAESALCRQVFIEKALAWPRIEFRFSSDGSVRHVLPLADTLRQRALDTLECREGPSFFYEISGSGEQFSFTAVIGSPEVVRSDRKQMMVFINGRKVSEYSLLQAVEYGAQGHFPNGGYPFCLLFIQIDPVLVDFNIHPAKKEVRFRDSKTLHHAVSSRLRDFWRRYSIKSLNSETDQTEEPLTFTQQTPDFFQQQTFEYSTDSRSAVAFLAEAAMEGPPRHFTETGKQVGESAALPVDNRTVRYLGQVLGTFLAVERAEVFYLIDQHAAHERILFDKIVAGQGKKQELLIPYRIITEDAAQDERIRQAVAALERGGFELRSEGEGLWLVTAVPVHWSGTEQELRAELNGSDITGEALCRRLYAGAACRAACKDGDQLDTATGLSIAEAAFLLAEPVCPHGRPIWARIDRAWLFNKVART